MTSAGGGDRAAKLRLDRRLQILEAAKEIFAERGYHNASISDIIQHAGIARGTFYLYFSNKRKVFDAILTAALERLSAHIRPIRLDEAAPPPRDQLHASLVGALGYLLGDRPLAQLLLNHGLTPDAESAERVDAFYGRVTAMIQSSLTLGINMGLVRPCNTPMFAAGLFGAIRGVVKHMLEIEQPNLDEMVDELIDLALCGVMEPNSWSKRPAPQPADRGG